jgi:hypothetical protein
MQIAETVEPDVSREDFARWIALQHLDFDPSISEVYYLPLNAPPREVRLIEVNRSLHLRTEIGPVEPLDFSFDIKGMEPFLLLVADVSPYEWEALIHDRLAPPRGWCLDQRIAFSLPKSEA